VGDAAHYATIIPFLSMPIARERRLWRGFAKIAAAPRLPAFTFRTRPAILLFLATTNKMIYAKQKSARRDYRLRQRLGLPQL
jgi:hypothetical protein